MKKIAVVTGSRAEYGILYPVLKAIEAHPDLRLSLVVTGMHLLPEFGYTVREIENSGFKVDARVDMLLGSDTLGAMAKSVGMGIIGMAQTWEQLNPDIILVPGDRGEPQPIEHQRAGGGIEKTDCNRISRKPQYWFYTIGTRNIPDKSGGGIQGFVQQTQPADRHRRCIVNGIMRLTGISLTAVK